MAFAPIAFVIPEYDRTLYANWWLKAYEPGTTTPKAMATDQTGSSTASRYELNTEGFPITAGGAFVVPHVDGDYDLWLFPTAAEADANDTANALQFADNLGIVSLIQSVSNTSSEVVLSADTVADLKTKDLQSGQTISTKGYHTAGDGGGAKYLIQTAAEFGGTPDGFGDHTLANGNVAKLILGNKVVGEQYGVIGDDGTDNAAPLQAAFVRANIDTAGLVVLGHGNFRYSVTIDVGFNGALQGVGYNTRLLPQGVTGFDLPASGIPSGRTPFKDFWIEGNDSAGTRAFNYAVTDDGASEAIKGVLFQNVFVQGFEEGWRLSGAWNTVFHKCETSDIWKAVNLIGRNIHTVISACNFTRGTTPAGYSGDPVGINQDISSGLRAEDIQVKYSLVFGFGKALKLSNCLYSDIEGCDFDFCVDTGVELVTVDGGCSVKSTWIFTQGDKGISLPSLGAPKTDPVVISGCNIERETQGILSGITGIDVGTGRNHVVIENNNIRNFHDAAVINSPSVRYVGNQDDSTNNLSLSIGDLAVGSYVYDNVFEQNIARSASKPFINFGENEGVLTKKAFRLAMASGVSNETFTWASLGFPDGMTNAQLLGFVNNGTNLSMGALWSNCTETQITVYRDTPLGSIATLEVQVTSI